MNVRMAVPGLFFSILLVLSSTATWAVSNLNVVVNGEQLSDACSASPCEVVISANSPPGPGARTYAGFTISGADGSNPAKVVATEGNTDKIELKNALITATQGALNASIQFWATFDQPPTADQSASPPKKVQIDRSATGTMRRGSNAAKDNTVTVHAWVNDLQAGTGDMPVQTSSTKVVCCLIPASYGDFTLATNKVWDTGFAGQRVMKGEMSFYQKYSSDTLKMTSFYATGNTVVNPPSTSEASTGVFDGYAEDYLTGDAEEKHWSGKMKGKKKHSRER